MRLRELSQTKLALGGDVTLSIVTDTSAGAADTLFGELWRQVYKFERQFSRFLPQSELSVFNRSTGLKTSITLDFRQLLLSARLLSQETNGLYNPFILPALQRAGYKKSAVAGYEHDIQADYTDRRVVEVDHLVIGDDWAEIPYGTALDLGGCGKGYLADQLGETLKNQSVQGYWLSLGGDIATMGRDENDKQLILAIRDAKNLETASEWVVVCPPEHTSVATSGTYRRKGQDIKKDWHHIIDPLTLEPAVTDIRLATVCAATAVRADVLASCAVILGSKKAPAFLRKHGAVAALLQCVNDKEVNFEKVFGERIMKSSLYQAEGVA